MSRSLYRISWLSSAGSEHTFENDPYDAIDVARANNGIISFAGDDYTADELLSKLEEEHILAESEELGMQFSWRIEA